MIQFFLTISRKSKQHMNEERQETIELTELTKPQRRVLGVLLEKAFTTPEYYPLTLKALTTGSNQKSNRSPTSSYSEDARSETLEELREMGLVGFVHTESGRSERYRHYMRHKFDFTERQLAVLTELLLRGRQQMGELRSRANRMVAIEGQTELREELRGLMELDLVRSSGALGKRGVEIDHSLYLPKEQQSNDLSQNVEPSSQQEAASPVVAEAVYPVSQPPSRDDESTVLLEEKIEQLSEENRQRKSDLAELQNQLSDLTTQFENLRSELGC